MRHYDPDSAPDAAAWLAVDESERIELAREYHRRQHIKLPNAEAHAVAHAIIETQLAEGLVPATDALRRLRLEGLDRHEAVHALAAVLMEHLSKIMNKPPEGGDPHAAYFGALDKLTAAAWRSLA